MSSLVAPAGTVRLPSPRTGHDSLNEVGAELRRRGYACELDARPLCGEVDVRLLVAQQDAAVVELLGPCGDATLGRRWQAVRIAADERVVWCGPLRSCPADEVARFVEDLLRQDEGYLTGHYTRLG